MARCCICNGHLENEDGPILTMGGGGYPRLLCDRCENLLSTITEETNFEEIENAMDKLGRLMADNDPDKVTFTTVNEIMQSASERVRAIKDGSYVPTSEEESEGEGEGFDEIPEELLESEEDKELDRIEEEKAKKFDNVYTVLLIIGCSLLALLLLYRGLIFVFRDTTIAEDILDRLADLLAGYGINLYDYIDWELIHKLF